MLMLTPSVGMLLHTVGLLGHYASEKTTAPTFAAYTVVAVRISHTHIHETALDLTPHS